MGRVLALAALLLIASRSDARAECRPAAIPSGEPTLVRQLSERLTASGIATTSTAGCPIAHVRLEQRGEQIHLEVTDSFGRRGTRQVRDVATAATIVESWTSQEIEIGTLPALAEPAPASVVVGAPFVARHALVAAFESSAGSDGSLWMGGAVSGCVRVSALCIGGLVRGTREAREAAASIAHDSMAVDALLTVGLPRKLGGFTITPGIGVGYGYYRLTEHHLDMTMHPIDLDRPSHGLHADAHLSAAHPIGTRLSLYADVRGDAAVSRTTDVGPRSFARASIGLRLP
jgi:hypothetical protein